LAAIPLRREAKVKETLLVIDCIIIIIILKAKQWFNDRFLGVI
jgi:hypothetical protein